MTSLPVLMHWEPCALHTKNVCLPAEAAKQIRGATDQYAGAKIAHTCEGFPVRGQAVPSGMGSFSSSNG